MCFKEYNAGIVRTTDILMDIRRNAYVELNNLFSKISHDFVTGLQIK